MIDKALYKKRVAENKIELAHQRSNGSFDITKFHGVDYERGILQPIRLIKKSHDIFAAVLLGFLPYLAEHNGADGVMLENDEFLDVELKTCYTHISPKLAFKTKQGTVYFTKDVSSWEWDWVDKNKTCLAKSQFKASFDIKNNLHTKDRKTFLICIDGDTGEIICVYSMEGKDVLEFLRSSNDIKLGSFMTSGKEVTDIAVPVTGWTKWIDRVKAPLEEKRTSLIAVEERRLHREIKKLEILQKVENISVPDSDSSQPAKIDPTPQTPTPCSSILDQQQSLDLEDTQPTYLSEIS